MMSGYNFSRFHEVQDRITQQHCLKSEGRKKAKPLDLVYFPSDSGTWFNFNIQILCPVLTRIDKSLHWRQRLKDRNSWTHGSTAWSWHKWCIQSDGMPRWHEAFSYIKNFNAYKLINTDFSQDDIFCIVLSIIPLTWVFLSISSN